MNQQEQEEITGANVNIFCGFVLDRNITKKSGIFLLGEVFFLLDLTFNG